MNKSCFIISISLLFMCTACVQRPKGVLSDEKMAPVIADLELAEAYIQSQPNAKVKERKDDLIEYVINKHGISRENFDSTMSWYGRNVDEYYAMCELAEKQLSKRKSEVSGASSVEISTSDLWPYERQIYMSALSSSDAFEFHIPTSEVEKGQRLNIKYRFNKPVTGNYMLGVEYDNGMVYYLSRPFHESSKVDMTFQTDTGRTVVNIIGNMMLNDNKRLPLWVDSIYLMTLPFDSTQYYNIHTQRHTDNYK